MITLPIPLIVSLTTLYLLLRMVLRRARLYLFFALLAGCALQGLLISLVHHYGMSGLRWILPVTASAIPPLAWLAFRQSLVSPLQRADGLHLIAPLFTAFCVVFAPATLDAIVPLIFVLYGGAILWVLRRADSLPQARLDAGQIPVMIWRALAVALLLSAISDLLIAVAFASGHGALHPWIVSLFSSGSLLAIALLGLASEDLGDATPEPASQEPEPADPEDDALMARLEQVVQTEQLYLDPELTLARLAKRLHVPIKQLSGAINRHTGENVSRYINAHRIRFACAELAKGESITNAIYASGFNTKSNFNREFRRVTGASPRDWLADQARSTITEPTE